MNCEEVANRVKFCEKELEEVLDKHRSSYGAVAMTRTLVKLMINNGADKQRLISDIEDVWDQYCE